MIALHIVEPTLADQAGHCYGYVQSLVRANEAFGFDLHLWLDRRGKGLLEGDACVIHPHFYRRWRKIQKFFCLRSLLKAKQALFIPTAGRIDLVYLDRLLGAKQYDQAVFLHFHQFKVTPKKRVMLRRIAKRHPEFVIMAPTEKLLSLFRSSGFERCEHVPCPGYEPRSGACEALGRCEKLIYAGAARADKGFSQVVDAVEHLMSQANPLPIELQVSPPASGRYDAASERALLKLRRLSYSSVTLHEQTLNREAYQRLFENAVCLLLYDVDFYRDKFSGVALDAFLAGSPVIAMVGTWAGDTVQKFNAGVALKDRSPQSVCSAVEWILDHCQHCRENAKRAGEALQKLHDPANTLAAIGKYLNA